MKNIIPWFIFSLTLILQTGLFPNNGSAQSKNYYELNAAKDIGVGFAGITTTLTGGYLLHAEKKVTPGDINALDRNKIIPINRWSIDYYSEKSGAISDVFLGVVTAFPLILLADNAAQNDFLTLGVMYAQSALLTAGFYSNTAGLVSKERPFLYNPEVALNKKLLRGTNDSFFSGHTAFTSNASFFFARVFSDLHPDSKLKPLVWGCAVLAPAFTGFMRIRAGKHFLTDVLTGYAVGAASGYLVPLMHRKKTK